MGYKLAKGTKVLWGDGGAAATAASYTHGAGDSQIVLTAIAGGTDGNSITITITNGTPLAVSVVGTAISITADTSSNTVNDVIAALYANEDARALIAATDGTGDGTGLITALSTQALSGGTNSAETFADLPGVGDITLDPGAYARQDITSHSSPGPQPEMINEAFTSEGSVSFSLNWDSADAGHLAFEADFDSGNTRNCKIVPPAGGGQTRLFEAQVMSLGEAYPVKGLITRDVQLNIRGSITKS